MIFDELSFPSKNCHPFCIITSVCNCIVMFLLCYFNVILIKISLSISRYVDYYFNICYCAIHYRYTQLTTSRKLQVAGVQ